MHMKRVYMHARSNKVYTIYTLIFVKPSVLGCILIHIEILSKEIGEKKDTDFI